MIPIPPLPSVEEMERIYIDVLAQKIIYEKQKDQTNEKE